MRRRYLDSMALVHKFGKLDIFLTVTYNPNWPEIKAEISATEEPQNRTDLLSRIFRSKLIELKTDISDKQIFDSVAAMYMSLSFRNEDYHMHTS